MKLDPVIKSNGLSHETDPQKSVSVKAVYGSTIIPPSKGYSFKMSNVMNNQFCQIPGMAISSLLCIFS